MSICHEKVFTYSYKYKSGWTNFVIPHLILCLGVLDFICWIELWYKFSPTFLAL
jgi:hypothetical protein